MLQATATLMAEEQGRLISNQKKESMYAKREYQRNVGYGFFSRLRTRVCSDSCLKFVYLSCATLISASFIIECILLHLIVVPYLSESVFELGVCKILTTQREIDQKKCENKCSKERSSFPCLQVQAIFTPFRKESQSPSESSKDDPEMSSTLGTILNRHPYPDLFIPWEEEPRYEVPLSARYNFSSTESRMVYLYDYFSTFTAHKTSKCSTSPCHRREEDNRNAVEEYKRALLRNHITPCYARPFNRISSPSHDVSNQSASIRTANPKDTAAILYRLYTQTMFLHSLCWPGGIFLGGMLVLLITYLADGCQAWARDKTVIA